MTSETSAEVWTPGRWNDVTSDYEVGNGLGTKIRLSWENGTVLVGRVSVFLSGRGDHQVFRMQTVFGGVTYVWPHGSELEVLLSEGVPGDK